MDKQLYEYKDIAENYDSFLKVMLEDEFYDGYYDGYQEFYLRLAEKYGDKGIIDIACGTGAVLLNLAEKGFDIDGTDLSEAMVDIATRKAKEKGLKLNIFAADMAQLKSNRQYSLAIIARGGFMNLLTPQLQRQALLSIKDNLLPNGILTFSTFCPNVIYQYEEMNRAEDDFKFKLEYVNAQGNKEKIYNTITYNQETQVTTEIWKIDTIDKNGDVINTRTRNFSLRQTYKTEMEYLIELCGFEIVDVYGDYYETPATNNTLIWVLKKKND